MKAQIRRSAASIVSNIAEGSGRETKGEFCNLLSNASGSASELKCQILLCRDLGYLEQDVTADLIARIRRTRKMLYGLSQSVKTRSR